MEVKTNPFDLFTELVTKFCNDLMRFTGLRVLFIGVFLFLFNYVSGVKTKSYLAEIDVPPSYRHMDEVLLHRIIDDTLTAKKVNANTVLVMGDCMAYGYGVKKPFTSYVTPIPGKQIVNISMASFSSELMVGTLGDAQSKGVKDVIIQLHPFGGYLDDEKRYREYLRKSPVNPSTNYEDSDFDMIAQAKSNWKQITTTVKFNPPIGLFLSKDEWRQLSTFLRFDLLQRFHMYRSRHILDDQLLKQSFYAYYNDRRDSYSKPLDLDFQIRLIKKSENWKHYRLDDKDEYMQRVVSNSFATHMARVAKDLGMNATFILAPTVVDRIDQNSEFKKDDFKALVTALERSVTQYDARFINMLYDEELAAEMRHYDNFTVAGHKLFAAKVADEIEEFAFEPSPAAEIQK